MTSVDDARQTPLTTTSSNIRIPVADGTTLPAYLARPAAGSPRPTQAVVVVHELFGVNPDIRQVADNLAAEGLLAVAPEFYHRDTEPGGWLERDDAGRAEGFRLLHRMSRDTALADVSAVLDHLRTAEALTEVTVVGFSAGGHLAYLAACRLPVARTMVLYGGWLPSTDIPLSRPEPTLELTAGISGELHYLVGADDRIVGADQVDRIRQALRENGVPGEVVTYPGVDHAFFWPGTPAYDADARADAWHRLLRLARRTPADLDVT
jgi:carboxymethylenebutenolidase